MERIPDNFGIWAAHEAHRASEAARRPVCAWCGEPIQEDYGYRMEGEVVCSDCIQDWLRDQRVNIDEVE